MQKNLKDSALVVVDMLYDFIDGSMACQGADGAIEGITRSFSSGTIIPRTTARSRHRAVPGRRTASRAPMGPMSMNPSSPT